jgi:hypothetical protein
MKKLAARNSTAGFLKLAGFWDVARCPWRRSHPKTEALNQGFTLVLQFGRYEGVVAGDIPASVEW